VIRRRVHHGAGAQPSEPSARDALLLVFASWVNRRQLLRGEQVTHRIGSPRARLTSIRDPQPRSCVPGGERCRASAHPRERLRTYCLARRWFA
jgi:hypothetical protein